MFVGLLGLPWMRDWLIGVSEKNDPGIWGSLLFRKRYIDEKLQASRNEIEAVVSLGTVDFDRDDLGAILTSRGYSVTTRTFFEWEQSHNT